MLYNRAAGMKSPDDEDQPTWDSSNRSGAKAKFRVSSSAMKMPDAIPLSTYPSTIEIADRDTINKRIQKRGIWATGVHIVNVDGVKETLGQHRGR